MTPPRPRLRGGRAVSARPRREPRVGVMTCALDEVACAAFAVGALVGLVDRYVFVDTGSTDGTAELIEELYEREIGDGRLVVERLSPLEDHDVSIARTRALELLRDADIDTFLKVDADDIFYDSGARQLVGIARTQPPTVTHVACRNHELYQWELIETREWLEALLAGRDAFWEMGITPSHDRSYAVAGAYATGKWGDEAAQRAPEGIVHDRPGARLTTDSVLAAHYGWARPVARKREKIAAWYGDPDHDPRVDRLHLVDEPRTPRQRFRDHPEVIARQVGPVLDWIAKDRPPGASSPGGS